MRVYVVESLKLDDHARPVLDVFQSTEAARHQHTSPDWTRNDFDEWESKTLHMRMTPHESKG